MLGRKGLDLHERVLNVAVGVHDPADRVGSVLGLCRKLQLGDLPVRVLAYQDDHLGRPRREVDRHVARDQQLGLVHVRVARPHDLVHALDRVRSVRERRDGLRTADRPHFADQIKRLGRRGDETGALRRRHHDDPLDPCDLRRYCAHDERRHETTRDVDADGAKRHPAPLELDARCNLEADVGRTLELVPAADRIREREQRRGRQPVGRLGAGGCGVVQAKRPFPQCGVSTFADVAHDHFDFAHASILSTGRSRIEEPPQLFCSSS